MVAKIRMTLFNSDEMQKEQVWLLAKNAQFSIWEHLPSKIGLMQSSDDWEMIKDKQRGWVDISDNYENLDHRDDPGNFDIRQDYGDKV